MQRSILWLLPGILLLLFATTGWAQSVTTDKSDYPPGSTVQITGSGFHAGETVTLHVEAIDGGPTWDWGLPWTTTANADGEFASSWFVVDEALDRGFILTADCEHPGPDPEHLYAQCFFTDSVSLQRVTVGPQSPSPVVAGGSAAYTVTLSFNGNNSSLNANLSLAFSAPAPAGVGTNFNPTSVTATASGDKTSTLTLTTTATGPQAGRTAPGSYPFTVTATPSTGNPMTATGTLVVGQVNTAPVLNSIGPKSVVYGDTLSFTATATDSDTPAQTLTYSLTGAPAGAAINSSTGAFSWPANVTPATYSATVTVTDNGSPSMSDSEVVSITVTKAPLTVTVNNKTRAYGDPNPGLDGTISGTKNGDVITAAYSTAAVATSSFGTYDIIATLSGANLGNYSVTNNKGTLTITKAPLTIKADDKTKIYAQANPSFSYTATGVKNGETFTVNYATSATTSSSVGSYPITPSSTDAKLSNYTTTYTPGNLAITQAPLTVKANDKSRVFGDANPSLDGTLTGVVNGDSITATYTTTADPTSPVGAYPITATLTPAGALSNYMVANTSGTLTVTKAATTTTLTSTPNPSTYGQQITLRATILPEKGQTPTGPVSFLADGIQVGDLVPLDANGVATLSITTLAAGTHALSAVYTGDGNFKNSSTANAVSHVVNKATAVVNLTGLTGTYNGSSQAVITTTVPAGLHVDVTYNGLSSAPVNAGSYMVVGTIDDPNYAGSVTDTLVVARATPTVSVSVNGSPFTYNGQPHAASATVTGVGSDVLSITTIKYNNSLTVPINADTYAVLATFNETNNYNQATGAANLVINKATASISLSDLSHTYDGSAKSATATTSPAGLTGVTVTFAGSAMAPINAGSYAVVAKLNNQNYQAEDATGSLEIAKANQTIDFASLADRKFGVDPFTVSATASSGLPVTFTVSAPATVADNTVTVPATGMVSVIVTVTASQDGKASPTVQNYNPVSFDRTFLLIENTPPVASASPDNLDWHRTALDITLSATDTGGDGVKNIAYSLNGGPLHVIPGVSAAVPISDTTAIQGDNVISYYATDNAGVDGNKSATHTVHVNWDTVGPVIDKGVRAPDYMIGGSAFYTAPLPINFDATDATSGLSKVSALLDITAIAKGFLYGDTADPRIWDTMTGLVSIDATDIAGNPSHQTINFQYDTQAPAVTINGVIDGGFYKTAAPVVTVADPGRALAALDVHIYASAPSTVKGQFYDPIQDPDKFQEITVDALASAFQLEGNYTLIVDAKDEVGVAGAPGHFTRKIVHFTIDRAAPEIKLGPAFPMDNGLYNIDQNLVYWIEDLFDPNPFFTLQELFSRIVGADGPASAITSPTPVAAEGIHSVHIEGKDHAENVATPVVRTFTIDKTPPVTAAPALSGTPAPNTEWFQTPVSIALSASDPDIRPAATGGQGESIHAIPGSEVKSIYWYSTGAWAHGAANAAQFYDPAHPPVVNTQGVTQFYYWAVDVAGNAESVHSITIRYDALPPDLTVPASPVTGVATSELGAAVTFSVNATDNVTVDGFPVVSVSPKQSGQTFPVGDTTISVTATDAAGHTTTKSFVVHVDNPAPSIETIDPAEQTYNPAAPDLPLTVNGSGFMPNSHSVVRFTSGATTVDLATTWVSFNKLTAIIPKEKLHGGDYSITVFTDNPGGGTSDDKPFKVKKANQTITFNGLGGKTYGDAPFSIDATSDSHLPVSFAVKSGHATINGNTVTITGAGTVVICATQPGNGDYNAAPAVQQSFEVAKFTPTVNVTGGTFVYNAEAHTATATVTGVNGDTLNAVITYNGTSVSPVNAGSYAVCAKFTANDNYNAAEATNTITINKANQTITWATPAAIVYGTPLSATQLNAVVSAPGSTRGAATYTPAAGTVLHVLTGTHMLTVNVAGTENLNPASGSVTIQVLKADPDISVTGGVFPYDRNPHPATVTITGVNNDELSISSITYAPGGVNAPMNAQPTPYGVNASFTGNNDYNPASKTATIEIDRVPLTVTVDSKSRLYGDDNPMLSGVVIGLIAGDEADVSVDYSTTALKSSAIGPYAITAVVSGPAAGNYTVSVIDSTLTVNKAPLTVTPNDKSREYGDANPSLDGVIDGIKNGDAITATYSTSATQTTDIGKYDITAQMAGDKLGNYDVTSNPGKLTITPAQLTIKADDKSKVYGDAVPQFSHTDTGTKNGDVFTVTYTTKPNVTAITPVGCYPITPSATGTKIGNYTVQYADGKLSVTKRPLRITATDKSKVYGAALPTFTATADNLVNGESLQSLGVLVTTAASDTSPVGTYPINPSGGNVSNYSVTYLPGTLTVTPATLTVIPQDKTMAYKGTVPPLTSLVSGLVAGDTAATAIQVQPVLSTTASSSSDVGMYPITAAGGASKNYTLQYGTGTLTIIYASNSGILQPINVDGTSVFKQGSTVPAKFKVYDANGNSVGTPGVVTSFRLVQTISGTVATTVNEDVTSTTPDTAFRWDATGQQWIFNINTKSMSANTTYVFVVTLKDGSIVGPAPGTTTVSFKFGLK